jgi:hypothetical protein
MSHILVVLCVRKVVSRNIDIFVSCVKNINFGAKTKLSTRHFLVFFTRNTKDIGFRQTWHTHIECQHKRAEFMFRIFLLFQNAYFGRSICIED